MQLCLFWYVFKIKKEIIYKKNFSITNTFQRVPVSSYLSCIKGYFFQYPLTLIIIFYTAVTIKYSIIGIKIKIKHLI